MGFLRFRRSFKVIPGIRINLSKTGVSTSIGKPGTTVNLRGDRVRTTVGVPGTGLSYTEQERGGVGGVGKVLLALLVLLLIAVAVLSAG